MGTPGNYVEEPRSFEDMASQEEVVESVVAPEDQPVDDLDEVESEDEDDE
jgi:hypothetical protein